MLETNRFFVSAQMKKVFSTMTVLWTSKWNFFKKWNQNRPQYVATYFTDITIIK